MFKKVHVVDTSGFPKIGLPEHKALVARFEERAKTFSSDRKPTDFQALRRELNELKKGWLARR